MSISKDVDNLYLHFGGDATQYQETVRDNYTRHAAHCWPLLSAFDIARPGPIPVASADATSATTAYDAHPQVFVETPSAPPFPALVGRYALHCEDDRRVLEALLDGDPYLRAGSQGLYRLRLRAQPGRPEP